MASDITMASVLRARLEHLEWFFFDLDVSVSSSSTESKVNQRTHYLPGRHRTMKNLFTRTTRFSWSLLLFGTSDAYTMRAPMSDPTEGFGSNTPRCTSPKSENAIQEWNVDKYQDQHSFVWKYGSSLIDLVKLDDATTDGKGQRILDAGCGSGELTSELLEKFPKATVHGFDLDAAMVSKARDQFPDIHFFQEDFVSLKAPQDGLYDVIFSNAALHWVTPRRSEEAIAALCRALRPGGQVVVEFGGKGNVEAISKATIAAVEAVGGKTVQPFWFFPSVGEISSMLEKNGVEVSSAALFDRPTPLNEGKEGLSNWLTMFGSRFLKGLTDTQIASVLEEVNQEVAPALWEKDHWVADYRRIRVVGSKQ